MTECPSTLVTLPPPPTGAAPPVLSTPADRILSKLNPAKEPATGEAQLSEEELYVQYEIQRTVREIREGRWKRIALQFPDDMLRDGTRVLTRLRDGLRRERRQDQKAEMQESKNMVDSLAKMKLREADKQPNGDGIEEKLCILADTSYGACCVDEIAAEHVDAEVIVHYGRACLSPTARLPVIYVFTTKPLDLNSALSSFRDTYKDKAEKVCLVADIPYSHHISTLAKQLGDQGYMNVFSTDVIRDPGSLVPNRTLPEIVRQNQESLKEWYIFHISDPPPSLVLILFSRVKGIHILPTTTTTSISTTAQEFMTTRLLKRRYANLLQLTTTPIIGILINTLSVTNYMTALKHTQDLIARAGKKSYTFVVGKINAAKIANFSEVGGWVVIGCWESSLLESKDFYAPIVTPFELEVALMRDEERLWGGEWIADFQELLERENAKDAQAMERKEDTGLAEDAVESNDIDDPSDDEPPEFDLRTGRYVSRSRPMGKPKPPITSTNDTTAHPTPHSSALIQRANGDVAVINGAVSPGAEFLRSYRTWKGLGSDCEIAYERDEEGRIRGARMEEGRSGVARGYGVGGEAEG